MRRSSVLRRFAFFSIGFSAKCDGIAGRCANVHLPRFTLLLFGHPDFDKVAYRGRQHVVRAFEVVVVAREAAERPRDVGGDGRLLGDDQRFGHDKG
jgi:hypothetical protein